MLCTCSRVAAQGKYLLFGRSDRLAQIARATKISFILEEKKHEYNDFRLFLPFFSKKIYIFP